MTGLVSIANGRVEGIDSTADDDDGGCSTARQRRELITETGAFIDSFLSENHCRAVFLG